jgi:hypothetical protein
MLTQLSALHRRVTLLRKLLAANSLDILSVICLLIVAKLILFFRIDFFLTIVSVGFQYTGPFFLKYVSTSFGINYSTNSGFHRRILDAIDNDKPTTEGRGTAVVYAFLAFICSLCKVRFSSHYFYYR